MKLRLTSWMKLAGVFLFFHAAAQNVTIEQYRGVVIERDAECNFLVLRCGSRNLQAAIFCDQSTQFLDSAGQKTALSNKAFEPGSLVLVKDSISLDDSPRHGLKIVSLRRYARQTETPR